MNLKSPSRQGHRKIAGRNRIAKNRRWRLLRISSEVSYAILPGGQRLLVHDPAQNTNTQTIQKIRSSSRVIGNTGYSRLNMDTNSLSAESSGANQKQSSPNPDSWGIMEEPLLPVGDWTPAIRLSDRPTSISEESPIEAPAVPTAQRENPLKIQADTEATTSADLPPTPLRKEIVQTPAHATPAEQIIGSTNEARTDEEEDSQTHMPAPGGKPDRSGGIVGFLSRIFKT